MGHHDHHHHGHRFDPAHIARLDSPERRARMPPEAIAAAAGLRAGLRVADVGAGSGYYTQAVLDAGEPPAEVHAIDVAPEMLSALQARLAEHPLRARVQLHAAPAERLPLGDRSVDLVMLGNVFHELDDAAAALAEARRVLAPGGRVLLVDWDRPAGALQSPPPHGPPWEHRISEADATAALQRAGFDDVQRQAGFREVYALAARRA